MGGFPTIVTVISVLNLVGSLSSCIGSGLIVVCYLILPIKRHFRHSLILNLAIADFLNSTNNSSSGLWKLISQRDIPESPGCIANGFFSQLTVQATDCSILAIAIVTVYALTRKTLISETLPRSTTFAICASTWVLPLITSFTTLGMNMYGPVSGNWCWIVPQPSYYRYVMTHGWRFAFILSEIGMYTYLHFYVRRRFGKLLEASKNRSQSTTDHRRSTSGPMEGASSPDEHEQRSNSAARDMETGQLQINQDFHDDRVDTWVSDESMGKASIVRDPVTPNKPLPGVPKKSKWRNPFAHHRVDDDQKEKKDPSAQRTSRVRKILLLNAYPAAYIILWIPGIVNRLVEASGGSSRVLQVLQASTQFVGLANAITYGWNERVGRQLKDYLSNRWAKDRTESVLEIRRERVEMETKMKPKAKSSKEKLREIRTGLKEGLRRNGGGEVVQEQEDQGHLVYANGRWEWSRSSSFNDQEIQSPR